MGATYTTKSAKAAPKSAKGGPMPAMDASKSARKSPPLYVDALEPTKGTPFPLRVLESVG